MQLSWPRASRRGLSRRYCSTASQRWPRRLQTGLRRREGCSDRAVRGGDPSSESPCRAALGGARG
eukprot:13231464-Alexandrium_andersonii.AAC.1